MSWDSVWYAWSESNKAVRAKLWDSWDWTDNINKKQVRKEINKSKAMMKLTFGNIRKVKQ